MESKGGLLPLCMRRNGREKPNSPEISRPALTPATGHRFERVHLGLLRLDIRNNFHEGWNSRKSREEGQKPSCRSGPLGFRHATGVFDQERPPPATTGQSLAMSVKPRSLAIAGLHMHGQEVRRMAGK